MVTIGLDTKNFDERRRAMSHQLGTLEELPQNYRDAMARASVAPLWPQMRNALPHNAPAPVTRSHLCR